MYKIDLNDPNEFTRENVAKLIGSELDTHNWQLRVTDQGIAFLSDVVGGEALEGIAFRLETWCARNNYVGFSAMHDTNWVGAVFKDLQDNWPAPKDSLIDF